MKLHQLEALVSMLKEHMPMDGDVLFSDYSRRSFPQLDIERPVGTMKFAAHVDSSGVFHVPLDTPAEVP